MPIGLFDTFDTSYTKRFNVCRRCSLRFYTLLHYNTEYKTIRLYPEYMFTDQNVSRPPCFLIYINPDLHLSRPPYLKSLPPFPNWSFQGPPSLTSYFNGPLNLGLFYFTQLNFCHYVDPICHFHSSLNGHFSAPSLTGHFKGPLDLQLSLSGSLQVGITVW